MYDNYFAAARAVRRAALVSLALVAARRCAGGCRHRAARAQDFDPTR